MKSAEPPKKEPPGKVVETPAGTSPITNSSKTLGDTLEDGPTLGRIETPAPPASASEPARSTLPESPEQDAVVSAPPPRAPAVAPPPPAPATPAGLTRITLIGLNDLHGNIDPRRVSIGAATDTRGTLIGGAEAMAAYIEAVRAENPTGTLLLDSGDGFQGTLPSNMFQGRSVIAAFNVLGVAASTFGNHEFDFKKSDLQGTQFPNDPQGSTKELLKLAKFPYLSANVVNTGKTDLRGFPPSDPLPRSRIIEIAGVRVGVIGATTEGAPEGAASDAIQGLSFLPIGPAVIAEAKRLRQPQADGPGAQVIVVIAHAGGLCDMTLPPERGDEACSSAEPDEITKLLAQAPAGTIDAVLAGHVHTPQRHFIRGVPVVQTFGFSSSFSRIDLFVNPKAEPTAPRPQRIPRVTIDEPTYFCHQHFAAYRSCNPDEAKVSPSGRKLGRGFPPQLGGVLAPTYHGRPIILAGPRAPALAAQVSQALEPFRRLARPAAERSITILPVALKSDRLAESPLNDCAADALLDQVRAVLRPRNIDLFLSHSGGIRASLPAGPINHGQTFDVFPFGSHLAVATLTGAELEALGQHLSTEAKNIAVLSEKWKEVKTLKAGDFPRHRNFVKPDGQPVAPGDSVTILTDAFNFDPNGPTKAIFARARAERRVQELPGSLLLETFEARLMRQPLPAVCQSAGPLDRTEIIEAK